MLSVGQMETFLNISVETVSSSEIFRESMSSDEPVEFVSAEQMEKSTKRMRKEKVFLLVI